MQMPADLRHVDLFYNLNHKELNAIFTYCFIDHYPKHTLLFTEGDTDNDKLYIVVKGSVKIFVSNNNGKETTLTVHKKNEYFGEMALLDDAPRSASAITQERSHLAAIDKENFQHCLKQYPSITYKLAETLVRRVRLLTIRFKELYTLSVQERVHYILTQLSEDVAGKNVVRQKPTQQEIANWIGASRESVSYAMRELIKNGTIELQGKKSILLYCKKTIPD